MFAEYCALRTSRNIQTRRAAARQLSVFTAPMGNDYRIGIGLRLTILGPKIDKLACMIGPDGGKIGRSFLSRAWASSLPFVTASYWADRDRTTRDVIAVSINPVKCQRREHLRAAVSKPSGSRQDPVVASRTPRSTERRLSCSPGCLLETSSDAPSDSDLFDGEATISLPSQVISRGASSCGLSAWARCSTPAS